MSMTDDLLSTEGGRACPVCGERATAAIELPDYRLFRCRGCGCWSSDALVRGASTSFEPGRYFGNVDADLAKWRTLLRRLEQRGGRPRSVLDVGCGTGGFLAFLAERLPDASREGIELDAGRAARARELVPTARIHAGDALEILDGLEGAFDLVTLWDVFEHMQAPVRLLGALGRLLAPGGVIYVQTIHEPSLLPTFGRWSHRLSGGRLSYPVRRTHEAHHLVFFTRKGLAFAGDRAGLRICELWFDRLARERMDGHPFITGATALLLTLENALGNGLFVNAIFEARS
jgi:2-polyprenyl-6-hydroxyphenyl methylase/3-demethylubiquinone-9 3-methyltransferase